MDTRIIDGEAIARRIREKLKEKCAALKRRHGLVPGLAILLIGDDAASHIYVRNKLRKCAEVGFQSFLHEFSATAEQTTVIAEIKRLNEDPSVHGIIIQLPLPQHLNPQDITESLDPHKDVDGLHSQNQLSLYAQKAQGFVPCTPLGCLRLLKSVHKDLSGLHAVIINRSYLVGKPLALLLLCENCSVTILHSQSRAAHKIAREADILVSAVGKAEFITDTWVKAGATLIDVGISRKNGTLCGDLAYQQVISKAGAVTPVPGGVGPMTIACLLTNTHQAALRNLADVTHI